MRYWFGQIPVIALLAIMAVSSCHVVSALNADASAAATRQQVQLLVKPALAGVQIAVAS